MENKLEVKADKDEFLFEIVNDNYMIGRLWRGVLIIFMGFLLLLPFFNYDFIKLANSDHRGHTLVFVFLPWLIIESIRIYIYIKRGFYKKIKFYETYIENGKNEKLLLEDLIDIYILKSNVVRHKVMRATSLVFIFIPIVICVYIPALISTYLYGLFKNKKTIFTDNLLLVRYDNIGVGIPLKIISKEDKEKVEWYIKKYLNRNNDQLKSKIIPPEYRSWNLVSEEKKEQILKEKFKK